jgi:hypothetical protein
MKLIKPPRVLSLRFSPGKPLGNPGDIKTQRGIIEAGFALLKKKTKVMTIVDLPFRLKKFSIFL